MTYEWYVVLPGAILCGLVLPSLFFWLLIEYQERKAKKRLPELIEEQQRWIEEQEEDISRWLEALELPQLADRTKRPEVARQLRTALFVR